MFERFTDRSRRTLVLAMENARLFEDEAIGTEHLLLGLIQEHDGVAGQVLEKLGVDAHAIRAKIDDHRKERSSPEAEPDTQPKTQPRELFNRLVDRLLTEDFAIGSPPFTPRAKKVLELSLREALQLGHNYIATEHILLGLIREGEGIAARSLVELGLDLSMVRQTVINTLRSYSSGPVDRPLSVDQEVRLERVRARTKHGDTSMDSYAPDDLYRLAVLMEEVGEVAQEFNDARHEDRSVDLAKLRKELIQTAAMASTWAEAIAVDE